VAAADGGHPQHLAAHRVSSAARQADIGAIEGGTPLAEPLRPVDKESAVPTSVISLGCVAKEPVMNVNARTLALISSLLALGTPAMVPVAIAADQSATEKCHGIVRAGKNDCAAAGHACSGQSARDSGGKEWLALPKGTCERIVGGSLVAR
jgi:uncharacterized membrane protein